MRPLRLELLVCAWTCLASIACFPDYPAKPDSAIAEADSVEPDTLAEPDLETTAEPSPEVAPDVAPDATSETTSDVVETSFDTIPLEPDSLPDTDAMIDPDTAADASPDTATEPDTLLLDTSADTTPAVDTTPDAAPEIEVEPEVIGPCPGGCGHLDQACNVGVCGEAGCEAIVREGECDDGQACTVDDRCELGACIGDTVVCEALDDCHIAGVCNPANGR